MIHQYKNNGYNIVLDVNSGSVHVVDDKVYDVIARMAEDRLEHADRDAILTALRGENTDDAELTEMVDEIIELRDDGMLFTEDIYEKSIDAFQNRETVVKALCLHIAHDCNLKCQYCFAEEGEYHGRRALMSFEVGKKALDFLVANSGHRVNLEVISIGLSVLSAGAGFVVSIYWIHGVAGIVGTWLIHQRMRMNLRGCAVRPLSSKRNWEANTGLSRRECIIKPMIV